MTKRTGGAKVASSGVSAGKVWMSRWHARHAHMPSPSLQEIGTVLSTTETLTTPAKIIQFMSHYPKSETMKFKNLLERHKELSLKHSELLKEIETHEFEVQSVEERIQALEESREKNSYDALTKAKDKRKYLRKDITELRHKARELEVEVKQVDMKIKWITETGDDVEE